MLWLSNFYVISSMRKIYLVLLPLIIAVPGLSQATANAAPVSGQHYIYTCPGYAYDPISKQYLLPHDCIADPNAQPATHQWLTEQVPTILRGDGRRWQAQFLESTVSTGRFAGKTHVSVLREGSVAADTQFAGCTQAGRLAGWPIGDHMLNPHRHFGVWSYYNYRAAGWQGYSYAATNGRQSGSCATVPRIRTNSAKMADEFFSRALRSWSQHDSGEAMFNLGVALHMVQDVSVPSHSHPEVRVDSLMAQNPLGTSVRGQDVYPAWANVVKENYRIGSGGRYQLSTNVNGATPYHTAGGFVYAMAATTYPYFPYNSLTSATPASSYRCDVTNFPEDCLSDSVELLKEAQRYSAGLVGFFFAEADFGRD